MAFTFQINNDLKFNHDEVLLNKSEMNRPQIHSKKINDVKMIEIVDDDTKLDGCGIQETGKELKDYA